jgi:hypothetical protein
VGAVSQPAGPELANFDRALESVHEAFGRSAIPVQLPLGSSATSGE